MSLISIILALVIVGIVLYLINRFLPVDAKIKTIINWVAIIVVIIWLMKVIGLLDYLGTIRV